MATTDCFDRSLLEDVTFVPPKGFPEDARERTILDIKNGSSAFNTTHRVQFFYHKTRDLLFGLDLPTNRLMLCTRPEEALQILIQEHLTLHDLPRGSKANAVDVIPHKYMGITTPNSRELQKHCKKCRPQLNSEISAPFVLDLEVLQRIKYDETAIRQELGIQCANPHSSPTPNDSLSRHPSHDSVRAPATSMSADLVSPISNGPTSTPRGPTDMPLMKSEGGTLKRRHSFPHEDSDLIFLRRQTKIAKFNSFRTPPQLDPVAKQPQTSPSTPRATPNGKPTIQKSPTIAMRNNGTKSSTLIKLKLPNAGPARNDTPKQAQAVAQKEPASVSNNVQAEVPRELPPPDQDRTQLNIQTELPDTQGVDQGSDFERLSKQGVHVAHISPEERVQTIKQLQNGKHLEKATLIPAIAFLCKEQWQLMELVELPIASSALPRPFEVQDTTYQLVFPFWHACKPAKSSFWTVIVMDVGKKCIQHILPSGFSRSRSDEVMDALKLLVSDVSGKDICPWESFNWQEVLVQQAYPSQNYDLAALYTLVAMGAGLEDHSTVLSDNCFRTILMSSISETGVPLSEIRTHQFPFQAEKDTSDAFQMSRAKLDESPLQSLLTIENCIKDWDSRLRSRMRDAEEQLTALDNLLRGLEGFARPLEAELMKLKNSQISRSSAHELSQVFATSRLFAQFNKNPSFKLKMAEIIKEAETEAQREVNERLTAQLKAVQRASKTTGHFRRVLGEIREKAETDLRFSPAKALRIWRKRLP